MRLAAPLVLGQVLQFSIVLANTLIVAPLGHVPLAALGLALALYSPCFMFALGNIAALSTLVAQAHGLQDNAQVPERVQSALVVAVIMGLGLSCIFAWSEELFLLLKQEPDVAELAARYLRILILGLPGVLGYNVFRCVAEGLGRTAAVTLAAGVGAALNAVVSVVLVHGLLGFPRLGVAGAGFSSVLGFSAMFGVGVWILETNSGFSSARSLRVPWRVSWSRLRDHVSLGLPMGCIWAGEIGYFSANATLIGMLGSLPLAAHGVAFNAMAGAFMVPLALSFAVVIRVGHAAGACDVEGVRRAAAAGLLVTLATTCGFAIVFALFPREIAGAYTSDVSLLALATELVVIAGAFQVFDGMQACAVGILRGVRDARVPLIGNLISFWLLGLPSGYFLAERLGLGVHGYWWGFVVALLSAALFYNARFWIGVGRVESLGARLKSLAGRGL